MSYQQFLKALSRTRREWRIDFNGNIRLADPVRRIEQCPISCLCNMPAFQYESAAAELGLNPDIATEIASAADSCICIDEQPGIRTDLLKACGLDK